MNELNIKENIKIEDMIFKIIKKIMLSSDIDRLYKIETKRINDIIKIN